ncbi:MAG: hypothetical protein K2J85_04305 [Anaeroplasmataceae bacterium]|nr:hypothetical protein [Anaeroplasmataceae bacterium]
MSKIQKRKQMFLAVEGAIGFLFVIFLILGFLNMHPVQIFLTFFSFGLWCIASAFWYHHNIKIPYKAMVVQPTIEGIKKGIKYIY